MADIRTAWKGPSTRYRWVDSLSGPKPGLELEFYSACRSSRTEYEHPMTWSEQRSLREINGGDAEALSAAAAKRRKGKDKDGLDEFSIHEREAWVRSMGFNEKLMPPGLWADFFATTQGDKPERATVNREIAEARGIEDKAAAQRKLDQAPDDVSEIGVCFGRVLLMG